MATDKAPRCDCGYELRARGEEDRVAEIRRHAWEAHRMAFSAEEALVVLQLSDFDLSQRAPAGAAIPTRGTQTEGGEAP